jgi:PAS domain S-box-containing protein
MRGLAVHAACSPSPPTMAGNRDRDPLVAGVLEDFIENAPIGLQSLDPDGHVLWANPAQTRMLGYDRQEYVGQHVSRFYADPEEAKQFLGRVSRGETLRDYAASLRRKDGRVRYVLISANAYRAEGRFVHTRCFVRDVTDARNAEQALEERAIALTEADRLKDEFLATLSHELRTPLNAVLGWARLLRRGQLDGVKRDEAIITIERNATAQVKLIDELLDLSRIASGKMVLDTHPVDLAEIVIEVVDSCRPSSVARGVELVAHVAESVGPFVGDGERLLQIVANLVTNAVKFTSAGGRVTVTLERVGANAMIVVADTGIGIPPDFLPHVFDRFRQADGSANRGHGGLGLGLAIARHLVELHDGTIVAESAGPKQGATFRVTLPLLPLRSTRSLPPVAPRPAVRLDGISVLIVDDQEDTLELSRAVLESSGADVMVARDADQGLAILRRDRPHVLISDIGLPGTDGYAFIAAVRRLPHADGGGTPACALTAYARAEDRRKVLAAGYQMHLSKPVDPNDLGAAISELAKLR